MKYDPDQIKSIVERYRRFMNHKKNIMWTDEEVSKKTAVARETLYSWRTGRRRPKTEAYLEALDRFLKSKGYTK